MKKSSWKIFKIFRISWSKRPKDQKGQRHLALERLNSSNRKRFKSLRIDHVDIKRVLVDLTYSHGDSVVETNLLPFNVPECWPSLKLNSFRLYEPWHLSCPRIPVYFLLEPLNMQQLYIYKWSAWLSTYKWVFLWPSFFEHSSCSNVNREIAPGYWWKQTDQSSIEKDRIIIILTLSIKITCYVIKTIYCVNSIILWIIIYE